VQTTSRGGALSREDPSYHNTPLPDLPSRCLGAKVHGLHLPQSVHRPSDRLAEDDGRSHVNWVPLRRRLGGGLALHQRQNTDPPRHWLDEAVHRRPQRQRLEEWGGCARACEAACCVGCFHA